MGETDKLKFLHFSVLVFEHMWLIQNKVRLEGTIPQWEEVSSSLNRNINKYWSASQRRKPKLSKQVCSMQWSPLIMGQLKFNTNVACSNLEAISGVLLRDHDGKTLEAWSHHFLSLSTFYAETEVVIQAFRMASEMKVEKACFEIDSLAVVLALNGVQEFED